MLNRWLPNIDCGWLYRGVDNSNAYFIPSRSYKIKAKRRNKRK